MNHEKQTEVKETHATTLSELTPQWFSTESSLQVGVRIPQDEQTCLMLNFGHSPTYEAPIRKERISIYAKGPQDLKLKVAQHYQKMLLRSNFRFSSKRE